MRPACVRWRAPWLRWAGCKQVAQSQHGRDGRPPFSCAAKSNFKVTMVLEGALRAPSYLGFPDRRDKS